VPGKPNQSLLIAALRHQSLEMPPEEKLPEAIRSEMELSLVETLSDVVKLAIPEL